MNMFAEIRALIAKPSRDYKKIYTQTDDIYIIWYTGYAIGLCLQEAEKIKHSGVFDHASLNAQLLQLKASYHTLVTQTETVSEENILGNEFIDQVFDHGRTQAEIPQLIDHLITLKELLSKEIKAYSTHLTNVFLFGFQLMNLKKVFLFERHPQKITGEMEIMEDIIAHIDKGDKSLHSPNLELVHENLNVLSVSLILIRKNLKNLAELKLRKPLHYKNKVNQCFTIWENILLDIKNPDEMIRGRFYVVVVYYYVLVIILGSIQALYTEVLHEPLRSMSVNQNIDGQTMDYLLKVLVIPALIWLFVFLYRKIKQKITGFLLRRRFYQILNN